MKYLLKKEINPDASPDEDEDEGEEEEGEEESEEEGEEQGGGAGVEHSSPRRDEAASEAVLPVSLALIFFKYNFKV